ncbi:hypothetical protein ACNOYE_36230 [Nannocystaceae bacterium ST9]
MIRLARALPLILLACRPEPTTTPCLEPVARREVAPNEPIGQPSRGSSGPEPRTVIEGAMPGDIGVPARPGELRFVDSDPHVAFFGFDPDHGLVQPAEGCFEWGVIGSRWWALDPWGKVVGEFELRGGEGYPVTNCYELDFTPLAGELGTGLLVAGPYREPDTARWDPDAKQLARLQVEVDAIDAIFEHQGAPAPLAERVLPFWRSDWSGTDASREWVAVGGRWLGLFSLEPDGSWRLRQLDASLATDRFLPDDAQRPLAAIDLDGDGDPELIVHEHAGPSWSDVLLRPAGSMYDRSFESPGGATI